MSYLLDALKKANGEEPVSSPNMQAATPAPQAPSSSSGYQWLSVILAILLALTVGYLVGTKWSWVEQQIIVQPTVVPAKTVQTVLSDNSMTKAVSTTKQNVSIEPSAVASQAPASTVLSTKENPLPEQPVNTNSVNDSTTEVAQIKDDAEQPELSKTLVVTKADDGSGVVVEEETPLLQEDEVMLGYVPEERGSNPESTEAIALDDVSPQLLAHFRMAVEDSNFEAEDQQPAFKTDVVAIHELGKSLQERIPAMSFTTHIYATDPSERWIKINGHTMKEGQWLSSSLQLIDINPQFVVMAIDGRKFTLAALTDWDGVQ